MGLVLGDCRTLDAFNQMGGLPCIFPFTYNDKTYNECSNSGGTCSWCATKVDNSGAYIIGFWGCCNNVCPKEDQKGIFSTKNYGIYKHCHQKFFPGSILCAQTSSKRVRNKLWNVST